MFNQKYMKNKISISIRTLFLSAFAVMLTTGLFAQEFKIAKSSGKMEIIEVNKVTVEGYNGNEIVFTSQNYSKEKDQRAEGLKAVSSLGLEDNTGFGLSVVDKGTSIEVRQLKKMDGPDVKIMVPKGVIVSFVHSSPYGHGVDFKNVESEIEISTVHNSVHLQNVTGPMTIKTVHGEINVDFNAGIKAPVSIASVHGPVDVTLPAATKANLSMSTTYGEVYVDPAIKLEIEKKDDKWTTFGSGKVNGKMNGGGLEISLTSTHNNIYLRKK
jgi:predicted membrane protein